MKSSCHIVVILCLTYFLTACIEEFDPPSEGFENLLVVEAMLTGGDRPFEVKLSRSIPLDTNAWIAETGALVSYTDDSGEEFRLWEMEDGIYVYAGETNAHPGGNYQLHITTSNGKEYVSDKVTMRETPPIDSIRWAYEEKPERDTQGIQFYVNTHDDENKTWYYRWEWDETWMFYTPYRSVIYWDEGEIKYRKENISTCWKYGRSTAIYLASSKILDEDVIRNQPLFYADNTTDRFNVRYSLNVKQYALSEEAYTYWKELKNITENLGTLFDPLPSTLRGNIHRVDDDNEIVLGYFDACTVQEQRIFISNYDIPRMRFPNYYRSCEETIVDYSEIEKMMGMGLFLVYETRMGPAVLYVMSTRYCIDCTLAGSNVEPEFWY